MNSTIRIFKNKLLFKNNNNNFMLKQANSNKRINKKLNKILKKTKGPRSPTLSNC